MRQTSLVCLWCDVIRIQYSCVLSWTTDIWLVLVYKNDIFIWFKLISGASHEFILNKQLILLICLVVSDSYVTLWTVAHQDPLFTEFSRQEYWIGLPFPSPGALPRPGIKPASPALAGGFFTTEPLGNGRIFPQKSSSAANEGLFPPGIQLNISHH